MSDRIKTSEVVDLFTLSLSEKERFIDSLYHLHLKIFDGVDRATFISYVIDSPAECTRFRVYKNSKGKWVGYCVVHRFHKNLFGRPSVIFRAEAGILREYRGRSHTLWFAFSEAIKYRLRHPLCEMCFLGAFVHPSVLYMISRYFGKYYPSVESPIPNQVGRIMLELANIFHIESVEGQGELVRKVGWITKESNEDRCFWKNNTHPIVKFYIKMNPGYINGNGLLTLVPLTFANIFMSLAKFVKNKIVKRFSK